MELTKEEKQEIIDEKIRIIEKQYGKAAKLIILEILTLSKDLSNEKQTRYIPVPDWNLYHQKPTVSAIRNLIYNREENGFNKVLKKDGKLWYIDEAAYFEWKESRFKMNEAIKNSQQTY